MTPTADQWPAEMTRATGKQVRRYRTDKWRSSRMSADQLAAAVTELGLPYTRAQVTNLEAGRRTSITVGEVLALAAALDVPPLLLIFPFGSSSTVEHLPGQTADTWEAAQWFTGEAPPPGWEQTDSDTVVGGWPQRFNRYSRPVALYRQHDRYVADWRKWATFGDEKDHDRVLSAEEMLASTREHMRSLDIEPPALPADLAHVDQAGVNR